MDSDEYSTDEGRKRRGENIDSFVNSKKMQRTPTKRQITESEKLDQLLMMMKEMNATQKDMKQEQKEIKTEIREIKDQQNKTNAALLKLTVENEQLKKENQDIRKENAEIRRELQGMKKAVEIIEKNRRKNNIVMNGLKMDTNEPGTLKEGIKGFFNKQLQIDITPTTVKKIGENACVIELRSEEEKHEIMTKKYKLRNVVGEKVFINDDLTKEEKEKQKHLRNFAKNEKEKGKDVKIGYNKVLVNQEEWRWNKIKRELEKPPKN